MLSGMAVEGNRINIMVATRCRYHLVERFTVPTCKIGGALAGRKVCCVQGRELAVYGRTLHESVPNVTFVMNIRSGHVGPTRYPRHGVSN